MAMGVRRGTGRGRGRYTPLSEINVTPLVDVMLVLLIVFMVAAPLMTSGITVDLPKASANLIPQDSEPITVSVDAQGNVFLGDSQTDLADLVTKLQAVAQNNPDRRIFVKGDRTNNYGRIMEVVANVAQGGFTKVALLAEQTGGGPAPRPAPGGPAINPPALNGAAIAPAVNAPIAPPAAALAPGSSRPAARGPRG